MSARSVARRSDPLGAWSARTSVVGAAQVARTPCSSVDRGLRRDREVAAEPFQAAEVVAVDTVGADPAALGGVSYGAAAAAGAAWRPGAAQEHAAEHGVGAGHAIDRDQ